MFMSRAIPVAAKSSANYESLYVSRVFSIAIEKNLIQRLALPTEWQCKENLVVKSEIEKIYLLLRQRTMILAVVIGCFDKLID